MKIKKIEFDEQWDYYRTHHIQYVEGNKIIGRIIISMEENNNSISSLYIQDEYRGKGYSTELLKDVLNYCDEYIKDDIFLMVRRDNFIIKKYKKLGFKFHSDNKIYIWMIKKYKLL